MNIAACVILYHPESFEVLRNIKTYLPFVKKLYIFDNSEKNSNQMHFEDLNNVTYFWDDENKGISIRLNEACSKAIEENFDYLLTMDQDSYFEENAIKQYFEDIFDDKDKSKVAVYGLEYNQKDINSTTAKTLEVDHLITSASIINLELYPKIGPFDENLFIDGVDIDYGFSAISKGFKNIKFAQNYFIHSLGEAVKRGSVTSFYLIKKNVSSHSATRIYYMERNRLYLQKKYRQLLPEIISKFSKDQKYHIKKSIKYSDAFFTVIKLYFRAKKDFKNGEMGRIKK